MKSLFIFLVLAFNICAIKPALGDAAANIKAIADAGKANAETSAINMLTPAQLEKLKAETARTWAEAMKAISEAHLNEAKAAQIYLEMERTRQLMRITEYEFARITAADYDMKTETAFLQAQGNLVRSLVLGHCNWKTWQALEVLMTRVGDADIIMQVMFDIKVEPLASSEFISNSSSSITEEFPGGNLGELYTFVRGRDFSFKKFGPAHKHIMRVVAMISKANELRIRELRDINEAIRLTIAKLG